jgi:hypothetical protein
MHRVSSVGRVLIICFAAAWVAAACERSPGAKEAAEGAQGVRAEESAIQAYDRYRVQGRIESLPAGEAKPPQARIQHQAIADFRDRNGKVVGMPAMTMAFALSPGVNAQELQVGDAVNMTFEMRWEQTPSLWIVELTKADAAP